MPLNNNDRRALRAGEQSGSKLSKSLWAQSQDRKRRENSRSKGVDI